MEHHNFFLCMLNLSPQKYPNTDLFIKTHYMHASPCQVIP